MKTQEELIDELGAKYTAAFAAHDAAQRELGIADGERQPDVILAALQAKVDAALEARREAFDTWIDECAKI